MLVSIWWLSIIRFVLASLMVVSINFSLALSIGVVDEAIISNTPAIQELVKPSEAKIAEGEKELESLLLQFQKSKEEFDKNQAIMDVKMREQQQQFLFSLSKQFQAKMVILEKKRHDISRRRQTVIENVCIKIAKQNKLGLIIANSAGSVLYADDKLDVTSEVVKALPSVLTDPSIPIVENN